MVTTDRHYDGFIDEQNICDLKKILSFLVNRFLIIINLQSTEVKESAYDIFLTTF